MNWALWPLLIFFAALFWGLWIVASQYPTDGAKPGGRFHLTYWALLLILYILRKSGIITWPEVVIFMILFVILFSLIVRNRQVAAQMSELRRKLAELEKITGIPQPAAVPASEKTA